MSVREIAELAVEALKYDRETSVKESRGKP